MRKWLPPDRTSLVFTVIMAGLIAVGIHAEQAKIANTQEYQDNYGLEIPLSRALPPPPTIQTIEITVETAFYLLGAFVGSLWTLYSTLLARINEISKASGDGEGKIDKRMDKLALELERLRGSVVLLESKLTALTKQVDTDRSRSDRRDDWIRAQVGEIQRFLTSKGFKLREADLVEPPTGALRPPTPPPTQGGS